MFYGWVCGAATQIFRIWLLHPDITIVEREPHQIRYNQYYGSILAGDDAGIAEQYKKLIIKNTSDYPIYFKYNDRIPDQLVEIVAITPTPFYHGLTTTITKEQLGALEAQVTSVSKHPSHEYNSRTFHSTYRTVSTEMVR
jgi:vancomycin resistance protein YoaR